MWNVDCGDWSSDVCSSDLNQELRGRIGEVHVVACCLFCDP
jgi:hypothetical protein